LGVRTLWTWWTKWTGWTSTESTTSTEVHNTRVNLKHVYLETLARCAPDVLVQRHVNPSMPRNVVAIGKCAGSLLDGVAAVHPIDAAFVAIPEGYPLPRTNAEVHAGGHPQMTPASFAAGRALLPFVEKHDDILFLISGGGSACVEVALAPHAEEAVARANARLVASGGTIAEINHERRELSAIKGGRLRERVRGRCVTLVYSDVSTGALADVASGPTITHANDARLVADNTTLTATAAQMIGNKAVVLEAQIECDVEEAAHLLAMHAQMLSPGQILVAGGEPTVLVRGDGRGGRCSELAVRFAALMPAANRAEALFASSDGVDGNSGAAGIYLPPGRERVETTLWQEALADSDSYRIAAQVGEPIMIAATGNNLRDLFLVALN
jgi:glycerate 2-kinase